ncbi:DNA cytosine methyltransferase [[Kitasatospora] papulosa]|uniref:DNA cytosine methyltransferase n=1 Tax=[Kitasatospora] papulosa TaxID=1464011 RepID=UPI003799F015
MTPLDRARRLLSMPPPPTLPGQLAVATGPRIGSVCTGYAGLDQAVTEVIGGSLAWVSDLDPGASRILAHRHPDVPNIGDLTAVDWTAVEPVDVLTGGYPCQPLSLAGQLNGTADARWIWPHIATALRVLRPRIAIFENVANHLRLGFDTVLCDLAEIGFDAEWVVVSASGAAHAPHQRRRLILLAVAQDADGAAWRERWAAAPEQTESRGARADAGGRSGVPAPAGKLSLLPTPAARDWKSGASNLMEENSRPLNEFAVNYLAHRTNWIGTNGVDYGPTIRRWETVLSRPAPEPCEPGERTAWRLSPRFTEWMMGLPVGHVTDVPGLTRNEQLHALGNGVVPQQAEAAVRLLLHRAGVAHWFGQAA